MKKQFKIGDIIYNIEKAKNGQLHPIRINGILTMQIPEHQEIEPRSLESHSRNKMNIIANLRYFVKNFSKMEPKQKKKKSKNREQSWFFSTDSFQPLSGYKEYPGVYNLSVELYPLIFDDYCIKEEAEKLICEYWKNKKKEIDCQIDKYCK